MPRSCGLKTLTNGSDWQTSYLLPEKLGLTVRPTISQIVPALSIALASTAGQLLSLALPLPHAATVGLVVLFYHVQLLNAMYWLTRFGR